MARIRSIKPEFWSDEKVAQLSEGAMAFFIGLWNFCDDEGKCQDNPRQLALRMPVFRQEDISRWLKKLVAVGLLQRGSCVAHASLASGSCVAWLRVTNWSHQRIDRPQLAKIKMDEIQWVTDSHSSNAREPIKNVRRKDRIGEDQDRIGEDPLNGGVQAPTLVTNGFQKKSQNKSVNRTVWEAFNIAYLDRYKVEPVRNAKVNSAIAQFVARIGEADAPHIATFFVLHNDSFYVRNMHAFSLALRDAESLRTQWLKGQAITGADVRRFERNQDHASLMDQIRREGI